MPVFNGSSTNNVINGKSTKDTLYGNGGDDMLYGGGGIDTLYGGDGNDILVGGTGKDVLWGGAGNDTFKYVDDYDSKHWENTWDTVRDFGGNDKIDLSAIDANEKISGNQNFSLGSGKADAKVWIERQGGDTYVNAQIAGGTWMEIKLDNFSGQLDGSDFIF